MPRDRANIRTDIWGDSDWRKLSFGAQWLYNYVLTHGTLNAVGVADWRPARAQGVAAGLTRPILDAFVRELTDAFFLVLDEHTEEVLVRSFFRHDGILTNPNMLATIKRDFAAVSSPLLLGVIAHEANRLRTEYPDGITKKFNPWDRSELTTLLKSSQVDARAHALTRPAEDAPQPLFDDGTPSGTPYGSPSGTPSPRGSGRGSGTTTSTATSTEEPLSPDKSVDGLVLIPAGWTPTLRHRDKATSLHLDVDFEAKRFVSHANENQRRLKNWDTGFTNWLRKQAEFAQKRNGGNPSAASPSARRPTAVEQNYAAFMKKHGGPPDGFQRDRNAIGQGISY
jgi:hypothetical protein